MADVTVNNELVLDSLLCFCLSKHGKLASKRIKDIVFDFYDPCNVSKAKRKLQEDIELNYIAESLPRYPERNGDHRTRK